LFVFAGCKKEDDIELTDTTDNGNGTTIPAIQGSWLITYEEAILGPNDDSCDVIFIEIQTDSLKILTFLAGEPAAGLKASYTHGNADTILMEYVDWDNSLYNWQTTVREVGLHLTVSADNDTLYLNGNGLQRVTSSLPLGLVSAWEIPDYATLTIESTGSFTWEATETEGLRTQSGTVESLGTYKGNEYLLTHITNCDYEAGENDYYTFNRYTVEADSLNMWQGEEKFSLSKPN
jgi:hypothetical protein